jgi:N-ethylmaleimide reductase
MSTDIFGTYAIGNVTLANRIVMAPMTRNRASEGEIPNDLMATYYAQRSSAGLIITEASQISPQGQGYPATPGIFNAEQVEGWKRITAAVHNKGGLIFNQLWHVGRVSHPYYQHGEKPVAPSEIAISGQISTPEGPKDPVTPRALGTDEIPDIVEQYRHAAQCALDAGFDGIEIHGANGYLLDQFLRDGSNKRTDEYGGSIENRSRLLLAVVDAVITVFEATQVGVRISPKGTFNDMSDSDPEGLYTYVLQELDRRQLAYLHVVEAMRNDISNNVKNIRKDFYKEHYKGTVILNSGYDKHSAQEAIDSGAADLIAIGIPFIANPDLVERMKADAPLNEAEQATFYGGDAKGYTDYLFLESD